MKTLFPLPDISLHHLKVSVIHGLWWKQPFASLMFKGKIETRKYPTNVRGKVLICATQKAYDQADVYNISGEYQKKIHALLLGNYDDLISGQAIGIGDLIDCRLMTKEDEHSCFVKYREPWIEEVPCITESGLKGMKFVQRKLWCWVFANVEAIEPFEIKGKQGWAILDEETKSKIKIKHTK